MASRQGYEYPAISRLPSFYFHRNVSLSFIDERLALHRLRDVLGVENLLWSTDFPHSGHELATLAQDRGGAVRRHPGHADERESSCCRGMLRVWGPLGRRLRLVRHRRLRDREAVEEQLHGVGSGIPTRPFDRYGAGELTAQRGPRSAWNNVSIATLLGFPPSGFAKEPTDRRGGVGRLLGDLRHHVGRRVGIVLQVQDDLQANQELGAVVLPAEDAVERRDPFLFRVAFDLRVLDAFEEPAVELLDDLDEQCPGSSGSDTRFQLVFARRAISFVLDR